MWKIVDFLYKKYIVDFMTPTLPLFFLQTTTSLLRNKKAPV